MRKLLNTLYVTSPEAYLALDGENILVQIKDRPGVRIPLLNLEGIVCFSYQGASPALMGACAERGISLVFLRPSGRFLARVQGKVRGNVLLRSRQHELTSSGTEAAAIARNFLTGKIYNQRRVVQRALRDHALVVDSEMLSACTAQLKEIIKAVQACETQEELRAYEGLAAKEYFKIFDHLILQQKDSFRFTGRNRRPPLDPTNALLSFAYTLLANECSSALESVGLDPYLGFLHQKRPGRPSLALDLMEELRPVLADRLVLSLINTQQLSSKDFLRKETGAILMEDEARKRFLSAWQKRKQELLTHPFTQEKISLGLLPYVQALLLARHLRGDLDAYPPFFWR